MKIANKCHYACKALLDIAIYAQAEAVVSVADIARRQGIPLKYLEQILIILKNNKILVSRRGQDGGYGLKIPAKQITVAQVVAIFDGSFASPYASERTSSGAQQDDPTCPVNEVWVRLARLEEQMLSRITIADLISRANDLQGEAMYYI